MTRDDLLLLGGPSQLPQAWGFGLLISCFWDGGRRKGLISFPFPGEHNEGLFSILPSRETPPVHVFLRKGSSSPHSPHLAQDGEGQGTTLEPLIFCRHA